MDNTITKNEKNWVRCESCKHKLFYLININGNFNMEIKCHSCKALNALKIYKNKA